MNVFASALSLTGQVLARGKLSILIYHQVLAAHDPMRPWEPTADVFDWQMALLKRYFKPLTLTEATQRLNEGKLPANAVCVTFDDGYANNLTIAQPILEKYGIPATVYVATAFSHGENMWNDRVIHLFSDPRRKTLQLEDQVVELGEWEERRSMAERLLIAMKYLPVKDRLERVGALYKSANIEEQASLMMTPDQVRTLSEAGVEIGAHTVNHPILRVLPESEQRHEIQHSKAELESWIGKQVQHFAYPNGVTGKDLDTDTVRYVQESGFSTAVVTDKGTSSGQTSPFLLKRFTPWDRSAFRFQLRMIHNKVFA